MTVKTFKIQIKGRVQGVGFRPFVFNLAKQHHINGTVSNNAEGVFIKVTTTKEKVTLFLENVLKKSPIVSIIQSYKIEEIIVEDFKSFDIIFSETNGRINIPLTSDFALCNACKSEIKDPKNRRFRYPFTTCVNCGPRYAITTKFPFERIHTSLHNFEMCDACQAEYKNPNNRRFHSQTNSCNDCGIQLKLVDANNIEIDKQNIIQKTAEFIAEGKIIALKNTNGYLLCCDATNTEAITRLRQRKQRPNKPFAVLYHTIEEIQHDFQVTLQEKKALTSTISPIVILENTVKTQILTEKMAPNLNQTGVLLPCSALLELLMDVVKTPIVCTSGNIHGLPIISENQDAQNQLNTVADYFLHHDLDIQFPQDDSVIKFVGEQRIILRRSRGYAPNYLTENEQNTLGILAMGAHLKSTFCIIPNTQIYVSQYFGNLNSYEVLERYQKTIKQQLKIFNCSPNMILIDAHPTYQSSIIGKELAQEYNAKLIEIQHHKAHFASVLGTHQLFESKEKILGVVWDGMGYGDDNAIWGGEFFTYKNYKIERINHFEYYDWIANDKMAQEPRLALFSLLDDDHRNLIKHKFSKIEWRIYSKAVKKNVLKTSSVGRLFDAVASALELVDANTFEGEAAMLLEHCAMKYTADEHIDFLSEINYEYIPSRKIITTVYKQCQEGISKACIAYSFIYTLSKMIVREAMDNDIKTIACSGGVFQNTLLISILNQMAEKNKIYLKLNSNLSPNDENISFGQLMYHQHIRN